MAEQLLLRGRNGGVGLRGRATAGRGGANAILARAFCSAALFSEAFASEALARSRDICCWLALSSAMLALSSRPPAPCWRDRAPSTAATAPDPADGRGGRRAASAAVWAGGGRMRRCRFAVSASTAARPVARRAPIFPAAATSSRTAASTSPSLSCPRSQRPARRWPPHRCTLPAATRRRRVPPACRPTAVGLHPGFADVRGAKRRIDGGTGGAARSRIPHGPAVPNMARSRAAQQIGNLFLGGHDPNGIGGDHDDIVRIIGWFGVQRGIHWCSVLSRMSPHRDGRGIYACASTHTSGSSGFDQTKAIRWRGWAAGSVRTAALIPLRRKLVVLEGGLPKVSEAHARDPAADAAC